MFIATRDLFLCLRVVSMPQIRYTISFSLRQRPPETGRAGGLSPPARVALARSLSPVHYPRLPPRPGLDIGHVEAVRPADPGVGKPFEPSGPQQLPQPVPRPLPAGDKSEILRNLR